MTVEDATDKVSAADKTAVEKAIGGLTNYKSGQYLDVNLFKVINGKQDPITETKAALTITFEVPAKLRGNSRTYSVIRVHGGKTTVLSDLDSDPNIVTIKTDKFSTYALTYRETSSSTPSGSGSGSRPRPTTPTTSADNNNSNSSDTTSNGSTSGDNTSSGSNSTSDESTHNPSESSSSEGTANPATGIAISFVPLAAVFAALPLTIKRRKK